MRHRRSYTVKQWISAVIARLEARSDNKVLALARQFIKFGLVGGHIEPGETDENAAYRELCEESGIPFDPDELPEIGTSGVYYRRDAK